MNRFAESYAVWLADYYLLATVLLALALTGIALLKQPAQRLMVTKSTLVALLLLAILCAVPGWSVVHLLAADRPPTRAESVQEKPVSHADAVLHPELSQANPVPQAEQPAVLPQAADETLIKPAGPKMSWSATFAIAHLAGMGCIAVWLALGWAACIRLRKTAQTAPANVSAILSKLVCLNGRASKPLQLFIHDRIDVAVALGVWQPMILLPTRWTSTQSLDRLQAVLAHESTHVLNHDLQWVALTRALFIPLWANPLFWLAKRRLRLDQEALADADAAEVTSRQQYAEQLVAWARDAHSRPALHLSSAVGLWESPSQLRQRIAILLDERLTVLRNCSRRWRITAGVFAIGAATALSMVTLQPASRAEEEKPVAKSTPDPLSQESLFKLYRKHFKLREPNVVGGFVVDEKLQPVAHAQVSLFRVNWRDITRKLLVEKSTDPDGKVRFDQVLDPAKEFSGGKIPPDNDIGEELLQVIVRAPGRVTHSHLQAKQLVAKRGEPLMIIMPPAVALHGRVTGPDGKPVAGALVSVGTDSLAPWAGAMSARTKATGDYVINDLAPFDLKQREEQEASMQGKDAAIDAFRAEPPFLTLTVEHPDFAVGQAQVEKTPGTTNVQLEPAAVLVGRVVFGDSGKPAGGARVWVAGHHQKLSEFKGDDAGNNDEQRRYATPFYTTSTHTDADGKYRLASLPPGYYHLVAEMPGWVNVGLRDISAEPGKTNEVFDLTLTKGGTVSIRLVDAKAAPTDPAPPDAQASIGSSERPLFDRPPMEQRISANKNGLFELSLPAGRHEIYIGAVYVGEERKWMSDYSSPTKSPNAFVTAIDSKTVQVDMPVSDAKSAKITGAFIQGPPPKAELKARPSSEKRQNETSNVKSQSMSTPRPQSNIVGGRIADETGQPIAGADKKDSANQPVEFKIIVAKYFLLHNGEGIQWSEIEKSIAALPDPKQARLMLYFTAGAPQLAQDAMFDKVHQLEKQYHCKLSQFGGVGQRAGVRYDAIRGEIDLMPKNAWRVDGVVQNMDGKAIAGVEVILCPPAEASWTFQKVQMYLLNGRLREPLDEILTHSDGVGKFAVYPTPESRYYLVALHRDGFGLARSDEFAKSGRIEIKPWAKISGRVEMSPRLKQSLVTLAHVPAADGWPGLEFWQFSDELQPKQPAPDGRYNFDYVVPSLATELDRFVGGEEFPYKEVRPAPGASESIDVRLPSENEIKKLEKLPSEDDPFGAVAPASTPVVADATSADKKAPDRTTSARQAPNTNNDRIADEKKQPVAIPIVVAKQVMLLNGKELITWNELDAKVAALPDPSTAYPDFYITNGAMESGVEKEAKPHMYELHRKFKLKGHGEGSLSARTSLRYDRIRNQADLVPDESLRINGVVLDSKNQLVAGAEVVLITPVDDSLSSAVSPYFYKAYDIALVEGRLRNRLDDVVTDTDAAGRFAVYPPKGKKYCLLVLHPSAGINIAWDQSLATESKVHLLAWAALVSKLGAEPGAKQTTSLRTQLRAQDGYPEINLVQYWSDLKNEKPTSVFRFTHVPPIWTTSISRDIAEPDGGTMGLNAASVSLLPGESRRIDLGPLSDKQREWLKTLLDESKKRSESLQQK